MGWTRDRAMGRPARLGTRRGRAVVRRHRRRVAVSEPVDAAAQYFQTWAEVAFVVALPLGALSLLWRFWSARGEERQQLKWASYGVLLFVIWGLVEQRVAPGLLHYVLATLAAAASSRQSTGASTGDVAGAPLASTRPSSWADAAASFRPVPAHPGVSRPVP